MAAAVMVAGAGGVLLGISALAVDLGSVYLESRKLQGMADLAAIAAARDLSDAQDAARATIDANGWGGQVDASVIRGRYDATPAIAAQQRFAAGETNPNAAQVELTAEADLFFGQAILGKPSLTIRRRATAARTEFASFSIGARLASLDQGAANALLSGLAGGQVSLSLADYNGLAAAKIDLFRYAAALRTQAALDGASFDEALAASFTPAQSLSVLSALLADDGQAQAAAAAAALSTASAGLGAAKLDSLIDLGAAGAQDKLVSARSVRAAVTALDLADAILLVAQEGRQVKLDLGLQAPGLTQIDVWLAIGERPNNSPWLTLDGEGTAVVRTNQARLYIEAKALSVLGILGAKPVTLPVLVELASGEAKLASISCPNQTSEATVALNVRPSLGKLVIGDIDRAKLNDFKSELAIAPATVVDIGLIKAQASALTKLGGDAWQTVAFSPGDIAAGKVKSVKTGDLAQATLTSLIGTTQVSVKVGGISSPALGAPILSTFGNLGAPLDGVLNNLTALLGVRLGEADVQVLGVRCRDAALVA